MTPAVNDKRSVVLFDGACNLCSASVGFVIRHDPRGVFQFASLQSPAGRALLQAQHIPGDVQTLVLIEDGRAHLRSTAALRIARRLSRAWPLLFAMIVIPAPVRDSIYDWIAARRYRWFGRRESCLTPTPELQDRFVRGST